MTQNGTATAVIDTDAEEAKVSEVTETVGGIVAAAEQLEVVSTETAQQAATMLTEISRARKASETARRFLTDPLRKHVEAINARFKEAAEPLDQANAIVRGKLGTYQAEQERIRQAEQERLEAEARAERERQEAEAREAREKAEAEAREAAERAAAARAPTMDAVGVADLTDAQLVDVVLEGGHAEPEARAELARRREARRAQEQAEAAQRAVVQANEAEQAAAAQPLTVARVEQAPKLAGISTQKRWTFEVIDPHAVPREHLTVDEKSIREAVRAGVREIPGVRIYQDAGLAVRA